MKRRRLAREQLQEIGEQELRVLRILCEYDGVASTAAAIGIAEGTLLRFMAGLGHRSNHASMQRLRRFFADFDLDEDVTQKREASE